METGSDQPPDRDEARAMFEQAQRAESETRNPPLPWGFFIAQAAILGGVCLAQMLPPDPARVVTVLGLVAIVGIGLRKVFMRPGYGVVWPDGRAAFPYVMSMLCLAGIPAVLAVATGLPWLWLIAGILAAAVTLEMGRRYRKGFGSA